MRITTKGQVTIPREIREFAGFHPGTEVQFIIGRDRAVRVVPASETGKIRKEQLQTAIARMRGIGDTGLGTSEIMALTRG